MWVYVLWRWFGWVIEEALFVLLDKGDKKWMDECELRGFGRVM